MYTPPQILYDRVDGWLYAKKNNINVKTKEGRITTKEKNNIKRFILRMSHRVGKQSEKRSRKKEVNFEIKTVKKTRC